MISEEQLRQFVQAAQGAARSGATVLESWRNKFQAREKGRFDLVTEADLGSQKAIFDYLRARFPDHCFLGEEGSGSNISAPGPKDPPTWIVDPLDGTTNYVHDCPLFCVSIALQWQGELVVGVVYDPSRGEMFSAARGQGAWLGETRLRTSAVDTLDKALLGTGFPTDLRGHESSLDAWRHMSYRCQSLRRTGTTALNLAYVAAGRFDGFWGFDNHVWDVAAGVVIIREAGGKVTKTDGSTYDPYLPDALASNGLLHDQIVTELSSAVR